MTPSDVDKHSFRDLNVMILAATKSRQDRDKSEWQKTLLLAQATINTVAKKPKPLDYLFRRVFPEKDKPTDMDMAELKSRMKQAKKLAKKRQERNK